LANLAREWASKKDRERVQERVECLGIRVQEKRVQEMRVQATKVQEVPVVPEVYMMTAMESVSGGTNPHSLPRPRSSNSCSEYTCDQIKISTRIQL